MVADIPFSVPSHLSAGLQSGAVRRVGALLLDSNTGRILAHMQETTGLKGLSAIISSAPGPSILNPIGFVTNTVIMIQNEQIKYMLEALQVLQIGNLIVSGAGLGVSLASMAVINARLFRLERLVNETLEAISRIERKVDDLKHDNIIRDLSTLRGACRLVDEAWDYSEPVAEWKTAARELLRIEEMFLQFAAKIKAAGEQHLDAFDLTIDAATLAGSTRVAALLASNEADAAAAAATAIDRSVGNLTADLGLVDMLPDEYRSARRSSYQEGNEAISRFRREASNKVTGLRYREELLGSKVLVIKHCADIGASGRAYIERARKEDAAPILFHSEQENVFRIK